MTDRQTDLPARMVASVTPQTRAVNVEQREVVHTITSIAADRVGDVIEPGGADVKNFMRNPVVLADHNYSVFAVIGRMKALEVTDSAIIARTHFDDGPIGSEAFRLVKNDMVRAWSIGFAPIEHEAIADEKGITKGLRFKRWELLEYSLVAIPMNPDALNNAIARGTVSREASKFLFRVTEKAGAEPPRASATPSIHRASKLKDAAAALRGLRRSVTLKGIER